jgi:hypothetical protein
VSFFRDPAEEFRNVPLVDAIWTRLLGRGTAGPSPSEIYEPTQARCDELAAMPYAEYLLTPEWKERRRLAISFAQSRCQSCGSDQRLEVHHLTYERVGKEWPGDLFVVCRPCHREIHGIEV